MLGVVAVFFFVNTVNKIKAIQRNKVRKQDYFQSIILIFVFICNMQDVYC